MRWWVEQHEDGLWCMVRGESGTAYKVAKMVSARQLQIEVQLEPKWFQAGLVQKVVNYCADDVALERDLCDFIERYGYVIHRGGQLPIEPWKGGK